MPIKREYKCQIIFQTAANVTQIAKKQKEKKQKIKQIKVTAIKVVPTLEPKIAWKRVKKKKKQRFWGNMLFIEKAKFPFLAGLITL